MNTASGTGWELRLGKWQDVLGDVECDALISDPPYSPRVHEGQRTGSETRKSTILYDSTTEDECSVFAMSWAPRVRHWAVIFSDHLAAQWWERAWTAAGWYVFAPVLWIRSNPTPRLAGDGPTSAADYITVARPRRRVETSRVGSRPGYYLTTNDHSNRFVAVPGGKQLDPMRSVLRDYTLPGDTVVDAFTGGGTTLLAAVSEGRRAIGSEMMPEHFEIARKRLMGGHTPPLFT